MSTKGLEMWGAFYDVALGASAARNSLGTNLGSGFLFCVVYVGDVWL